MRTFDTITDAREAIMDFRADHLKDLPEELQAKFKAQAASPSPVDQIVGVMELLYANKEGLSNEAKDLIGGLAAFATVNAWHGLAEDERGSKIVQAMSRDLGEKLIPGFKAPKPEADPAAKDQYILKDEEQMPLPQTQVAAEAPSAEA